MGAKGIEHLVNALNINQVRSHLLEFAVRPSLSFAFQTLMKWTFFYRGVAPEIVNHFRRGVTIEVVREDLSIIADLRDTKRHSRMMIHMTNTFGINWNKRREKHVEYSMFFTKSKTTCEKS
jgi:hypothetical protein